jgi:hypothetical protein
MKLILKAAAALTIAALITVTADAQKIKVTEGDLSALKGQTEINTTFEYENIKVGKFDKEEDYINKKKDEYNKKEAGKGDTWEKAWKADRTERFEPKFNQLFTENGDIKAGDFSGAKYTLVFKTTFVEPGFNIAIAHKSASVDGEVWIIETASKKVIAKLSVDDCPGRTFGGFDFDTGLRLQESYAVAGKGLAKFFKKKLD